MQFLNQFIFFSICLIIPQTLLGSTSNSCDSLWLQALPLVVQERIQSFEKGVHFEDKDVGAVVDYIKESTGDFGDVIDTWSPLRYLLTMHEIRLLAKEPLACKNLSDAIEKDQSLYLDLGRFGDLEFLKADKISLFSAVVSEYSYIKTLSSRDRYSESEFVDLAEIVGLVPTIVPFGYRFDSRSPNEIKEADGFYPNPTKQRGSLTEHSMPNLGMYFSAQGAGFVSTSSEAANSFNLSIYPVFSAAKLLPINEIHPFQSQYNIGTHRVGVVWEYQIQNYLAVKPNAFSRIEGENELVAPGVSLSHIPSSRKIFLLMEVNADGIPKKVIDFRAEDWRPFPIDSP